MKAKLHSISSIISNVLFKQYFKENSYIINAKKPLLSFLNNESQKATYDWENSFLLAKMKMSEIIYGTQMEKKQLHSFDSKYLENMHIKHCERPQDTSTGTSYTMWEVYHKVKLKAQMFLICLTLW